MAAMGLMTADELAKLPGDGWRYDLIEGELLRMAPAGGEHGEVGAELGSEIRNFVRSRGRGRAYAAETGFKLSRNPDVVMGPDVAFVRADRLPSREQRRGYIELAPDLVVEIVSPSDRRRDVMAKVGAYLAHGVHLIWLVEPGKRLVTVFRSGGSRRVLTETTIWTVRTSFPASASPSRTSSRDRAGSLRAVPDASRFHRFRCVGPGGSPRSDFCGVVVVQAWPEPDVHKGRARMQES